MENAGASKEKGFALSDASTGSGAWIKYFAGAVVVACYFLFYGRAFPDLAYDWLNYYGPFSYCALIPLLSLYVVWTQRKTLAKLPVRPALYASVFVILAIAIGVVGKIIGDSFTVRVSMVLAVAALVHLILGFQFLKALLFPIGYLFLMIPWPYVLVKEVAFYLRIIDAVLAAGALQLLGIPVYRDSYYLHLPNITLEVADLCSGISSVFALFALGTYYAYFLPARPTTKLAVIASTFPFAALVNLLRIVLTSALAYYIGTVALSYLVHEFTGVITFLIALASFIALGEFLQRRSLRVKRPYVAEGNTVSLASSFAKPSGAPSGRSWIAFLTACFILLAGGFLSWRAGSTQAMPLTDELQTLPLKVGQYGSSEVKSKPTYRDSKAETDLSRIYAGANTGAFDLYIGYRSFQQGDNRLHSPKLIMLPGENFISLSNAEIPLAEARALSATWMVVQMPSAKQLVLYWYQTGKQSFGGEIAYRLHQMERMILANRTDAAVVRIATPIGESEAIEHARARLASFAAALYPALVRILPE